MISGFRQARLRPLAGIALGVGLTLAVAVGCSTSDDRVGYIAPPAAPGALGPNGVGDAATADANDSGFCTMTDCPAPYATCATSTYRCDKNLDRDNLNCGGCGIKCPGGDDTTVEQVLHADWRCGSGQCQMSCMQGFADCNASPGDGCEANTQCDPNNCGGCGIKCGAGVECIAGNCGCPNGTTKCGDAFCGPGAARVCKDLQQDDQNCGSCGNACPQPPNLPPHTVSGCGGGTCGHLKCETGYDDCNDNIPVDGCETKLGEDPNNCGACGFKCAPGQACFAGQCLCPPGAQMCTFGEAPDEKKFCFYVDVDPKNCGACGRVCPTVPNGEAACRDGRCLVDCPVGFADCDDNPRTGCETSTDSDPNNCGGCGIKCDIAAGQPCIRGQCALAPCPEKPVQ